MLHASGQQIGDAYALEKRGGTVDDGGMTRGAIDCEATTTQHRQRHPARPGANQKDPS